MGKSTSLLIGLFLAMAAALSHSEIVVIVHADNPVSKLSQQEIQRLFLGRMNLFPGSNLQVNAIDHSTTTELHNRFYSDVIQMSQSKLKRYRAYHLFSGKGRLPMEMSSTRDILEYVASSKHAIAYVEAPDITQGVKVIYRVDE